MLTYLRISNFAILDEVELEFGPGLTVLSGETGAGKSLILDAVSLLRGGRAPADLIRTGADEARIEAIFAPPGGSEPARALQEKLGLLGLLSEEAGEGGGRLSDEGLVVRRLLAASGGTGGKRSRVYLGGQISTVQTLGEVIGGLIDIAGQHEHQSLLDPSRHLPLIDRCMERSGERGAAEIYTEMTTTFARLEAAIARLRSASLDERARTEREEFLRFQLDELQAADPKPGEDEALREEQKRLRAAGKLHGAARRGEEVLYSAEGAVLERLAGLRRELSDLGHIDKDLGTLATQLGDAEGVLEDVAHSLRRYADTLRANPERLAEIDDRLHLLSRLLRKHGPDMAALLGKRAEMEAELARLQQHEAHRADAESEVAGARKAAAQAAARLQAMRQKVAAKLSKAASAALSDLSMRGAEIDVRLDRRPAQKGDDSGFLFELDGKLCRLARDGWDRCELLLKSNVGEEARPLSRIASGGELSRVMLALRGVIGQADSVSTCVFDEVDSGIGGATADRVGRHIRAMARHRQVLCITHLAQIAAYADHHLRVEKHVTGGRTITRVRKLSDSERRDEIARMLGGARLTEKSRAHADELLREATSPA
jgi:DNA repair protein RecN (Recombination protein N)